MRDEEIRQLIRLLEENEGITEIELSVSPFGKKIRVSRQAAPSAAVVAAAPAPGGAVSSAPGTADESEEAASDLHTVKAPMVGTFYRRPNPEAEVFTSEGARVAPGSVLCIVEAMKLMNEIESDIAGLVREILVEDGQAVEFGQPLFRIEKL